MSDADVDEEHVEAFTRHMAAAIDDALAEWVDEHGQVDRSLLVDFLTSFAKVVLEGDDDV